MLSSLLLTLAVAAQSPDSIVISGARDPAISSNGWLAFEQNGDIWISQVNIEDVATNGTTVTPVRVTSGPAWDKEPAWSPDGKRLVFASDRLGSFDVWSVAINEDGRAGDERALTDSPEPEAEPTVGRNGVIVFVRGHGTGRDLWLRDANGSLSQLTDDDGAEFSPAVSPDGNSLAYISEQVRQRQLRIRSLEDDDDEVVLRDIRVEHIAWSPDGNVIAFAKRGSSGGVWVTPRDGAYTNLVSRTPGAIAWSPDGEWLVLTALPRMPPGYNGDPNRMSDRTAGDITSRGNKLLFMRAPSLPDAAQTEVSVTATTARREHNAEAFDRVWSRLNQLYYRQGAWQHWGELRDTHRPRALAATSETELQDVIYQLLRERPPIHPEKNGRAAVSSAHPLATEAGLEILRKGGNVIDAAVAVSFALGVVEPDASGLGGYGEMVLYVEGMEKPAAIEFLTRVPEAAALSNAALSEDGRLPVDGPILANVPGTVAGMWKAWSDYGSGDVEWSDLLQPAIRSAEEGFVLDEAFTTTLDVERERFLKYESSKALFFPDGEPLKPGDTLRNPDLAWTLKQIAAHGADAFYSGAIAERMVADLRGKGNVITRSDLSRYFASTREPIAGTYRGHTIYSAVPAASGGVSLVAKLHLLDNLDSAGLYQDDWRTLHAMIEAWKLEPSSANRVADPNLWPVDVEPLLNRETARRRWSLCFDVNEATGPAGLRREDDKLACEETDELVQSWGESIDDCERGDDHGCPASGTTAFTVADADGNIVAVTQTLGTWGGNFYVSPGLGFLYNDKLGSYRTSPSAYGARLPYARHGTSIAPTLVFRGTGQAQRPFLAVGAAGNAWITSAVYQVVAATIDAGVGPQQALELPRFLVRVRRSSDEVDDVVVQIEDGYSPRVMQRLEEMGHEFQRISLRGELRMGYGAAVMIDAGMVRAGADPRRSGAAGAIP